MQVKNKEESKYTYDYYKLIGELAGKDAFRPTSEGGCPLIAQGTK